MEVYKVAAIAVALAMDAFAVSIAVGLGLGSISFRQRFRLAWHFGLFQALMPIIGWSAGLTVRPLIENYDHWMAFGLLTFVAVKMIYEAFSADVAREERKDPTRGLTLVVLAIATSIDALAVGLSMSMLRVSIWTPALIIGLVAGVFTVIGLHLGKNVGSIPRLSRYAEALGGIVLLIIGLKILHEHGVLAPLL